MLAYQLPPLRDRTLLRRRASGLGLALGVNLLLFLVLLGLGKFTPGVQKPSSALIVDLVRNSERAATRTKVEAVKTPTPPAQSRPLPKPPPIVLPARPTIAAPLWVEMSKDDLAAGDIANLPRSSPGDSEEVGRAPNGDVLYAAQWAREPTDAELSGYLPANARDGYGLVACRTLPENRVDDCVELENYPAGSHLASAVRQAAWQFRVRPPRKNGRALVGSWVRIRIDYQHYGGDDGR